MSNWIHRFFNPHCPHCYDELKESRVCLSCDTLQTQIERLTFENTKLLNKLFTEPAIIAPSQPMEPTRPINVPWNVRRQMLEAEDRERAKLIRNAPISTDELEKELKIAEEKRS
jgi:hypothetical protein